MTSIPYKSKIFIWLSVHGQLLSIKWESLSAFLSRMTILFLKVPELHYSLVCGLVDSLQ